jgi:hypothetical protein
MIRRAGAARVRFNWNKLRQSFQPKQIANIVPDVTNAAICAE